MAEQMKLPPFKREGTSFLETCFNGVNALSGIGIITIPYTLAQCGWSGLGLLLGMAILTGFTGLLLQRCMDSNPAIKTYSDIGYVAFGRRGRLLISTIMYLELYLVSTGFLILEGDNLDKLFPNFNFKIGGHHFGGRKYFIMVAGLVILPTVWLKDLSVLSFVSAGGLLSIIIIIGSISWVGAVDGVGFSSGNGDLFRLGGVPTALSLYAFCYGAHAVFPTLYSSMNDKSKFSKVLIISFALTTTSYISMAIIGYLMFGDNVLSQVTLNLPTNKVSSKIAIYTILAGPVAKYALIMMPIANAIESLLPVNYYNVKHIYILIRSLLLISTVVVALVFPFFDLLMALVGAILNVTISILLPCICYLKIFQAYRKRSFEVVVIFGIIIIAVSIEVIGTYSSFKKIVNKI